MRGPGRSRIVEKGRRHHSRLRIQDVTWIRDGRSTGTVEVYQRAALKGALATPPRAPGLPENPVPLRDETSPVGPVEALVR